LRRLAFVLAAFLSVAALVTACASGPTGSPGASGSANLIGVSFAVPDVSPTPEVTLQPVDISNWWMVAPAGLGFGLAFPGPATAGSTTIAGLRAPAALWTYRDPGYRIYQLARIRLPAGAITSDLKATMGRLVAQTVPEMVPNGQIANRSDVTTDGRPGIRFLVNGTSATVEGVLVLDNTVLYRVSVTYDPTKPDRADLEAFVANFSLTTQ
jgi:hypothetical protein